MAQQQLIYISRPFGFDDATLNSILFTARFHNRQNDMSGALICREDIFLQMLEGPRSAVDATYERIRRDQRHLDVHLLWFGESDTRQFADWDMRHDPARSWLWTPDEVWSGAPLKASAGEIRAIFDRVKNEAYTEGQTVL